MKFYAITWTKQITVFTVFILLASYSNAQSDLASPYTVFGPGMANYTQTVSQAGMGGAGVALFDPYKMNFSNPANQAYHLETIFETSGKGTHSTFSTNDGEFENQSFLLNNLSLSFPIKRGVWGMSIGLQPYTTVGYDVLTTLPNPDLGIDPVTKYTGDGGISQGYLSMGHKFFNKVDSARNVRSLALGATFNFNFGTVDNNRQLSFPGDVSSVGIRIEESTLLRDASFDLGMQYQTNIIKRTQDRNRYLKLLLGATYALGMDLNAQRSSYAYNFTQSSLFPGDTLYANEREKGIIHVPTKYTIGMGLDYVTAQRRRYRLAIDYSSQNWSEYKEEFASENRQFQFQDSWRISTGFEYTPELGATEYLRTVEYRLGFDYEKSNLNLRGTDINDLGMSFGLSLPLHHRRGLTKSTFHIAGKYGVQGTTDNNLIQENYFRIFVGFSFTPHFRNRWFVQPKYD